MVNELYDVRWDKIALIQFKEIFIYIRKDSYQNALKVKQKILQYIADLKSEPRRHAPDRLRLDHDEAFRSFEVYNIRVTYFVDDGGRIINIIRVRSIRQEPLSY